MQNNGKSQNIHPNLSYHGETQQKLRRERDQEQTIKGSDDRKMGNKSYCQQKRAISPVELTLLTVLYSRTLRRTLDRSLA